MLPVGYEWSATCNIGYPSETHFKFKSSEISVVHIPVSDVQSLRNFAKSTTLSWHISLHNSPGSDFMQSIVNVQLVLNNLFSLRCLEPWINHLPPVWWFMFMVYGLGLYFISGSLSHRCVIKQMEQINVVSRYFASWRHPLLNLVRLNVYASAKLSHTIINIFWFGNISLWI